MWCLHFLCFSIDSNIEISPELIWSNVEFVSNSCFEMASSVLVPSGSVWKIVVHYVFAAKSGLF